MISPQSSMSIGGGPKGRKMGLKLNGRRNNSVTQEDGKEGEAHRRE